MMGVGNMTNKCKTCNEYFMSDGSRLLLRDATEDMVIDVAKLKVGDKVHYQPLYYPIDTWENGMVKEIRKSRIVVVFNCDGNWNRHMDYTGALTNLKDLKFGWKY